MRPVVRWMCALFVLWSFLSTCAIAQTNSSASPAPQASPAFDVNAAVNTYLAKMPPAQRERSNAYFEGGYWLQLWDFVTTIFIMWLLLRFRLSAGMRNLAQRITRFRPLQTAIY